MGDLRSRGCSGQSTNARRGRCSRWSIAKESARVEKEDTAILGSLFEVIRRQDGRYFIIIESKDSHVVEEDETKTRSHGRLLFSFIPSTTLFSFSSLSQSESFDGLAAQDTLSSDITVTDSTKSHPLLSGNAS